MRIIFISWWWPYPASNGSKIRIYNLLRNLAASHEVTLLSFADPDEATPPQVAHMREFCAQVEVVPKPVYRPGSLRALMGYFSRWPRSLIDTYSEAMANQVQRAAPQADLLMASELHTLRYLEAAPDIPAMLEDAELASLYDRVEQAGGTSSRLRAQMTLVKLENALRRLLQRGGAVTVASPSELDRLSALTPDQARIAVIPNGVDTVTNRPGEVMPEPNTLIYPGAVTYNANYDAVTYFIHEILPLVQQRIPGVRFVVTGGTGSVDVSDLAAQPGVTFTGYLPEITPAVQASWATVVPLRVGSGTRLKILESMALGTPVISTRKGAEGLDVHPDEDILIADEPAAMAEAICTLLNDAALRARLAQRGRALVEDQYDWASIAHKLVALAEATALQKVVLHGE